MKRTSFIFFFLLLLFVQLVLAKYAQLAPFVYFCFVPALVLSIPTARAPYVVMLIAFACGIAIDVLADGLLALNAGAATLVAALQKGVIRLFVDQDVVERHYTMSYKRYGVVRILSALFAMTLLYFSFYVIADNAGFRSVGFILTRIILSTFASMPLGAIVVGILCPYQK